MTREESKKQQNVSNDNNTFNEDGSIINTKSNSQETSKKVNSECEKKTECTEQKMVGNYSHKDKDGAFTESYSHENTKNVLNNFFKNEEINQKNVFSDNEIKGKPTDKKNLLFINIILINGLFYKLLHSSSHNLGRLLSTPVSRLFSTK